MGPVNDTYASGVNRCFRIHEIISIEYTTRTTSDYFMIYIPAAGRITRNPRRCFCSFSNNHVSLYLVLDITERSGNRNDSQPLIGAYLFGHLHPTLYMPPFLEPRV